MPTVFRFELGATWLNLQSTVTGRLRSQTVDLLDSPASLGEWLAAVGLAPLRRPNADDLLRTRRLREALYDVVRARVDEVPVPRAAVRVLNETLGVDRAPRVSVTADGMVAARPKDTAEALARIARQAVDALAGPDPVRLNRCSDDDCSGIFVDETGRRRWSSDSRCGSRARVSAHRARNRG